MMLNQGHKHFALSKLEWMVMPSFLLEQYQVFRSGGRLRPVKIITKPIVAVITFAAISGCASGSMLSQDCNTFKDNPGEYRKCNASNGNQQAQFELGREAYVKGDLKTAKNWLRRAAQTRPHRIPVYVPPVGSQTVGRVMYVDSNNGTVGHTEARRLLKKINEENM